MKRILTHDEIQYAADLLITRIIDQLSKGTTGLKLVYAIPRGGIPVWYLIKRRLQDHCSSFLDIYLETTEDPTQAHIFIDDLVDSGATRARYLQGHNPEPPWFALYDKERDGIDAWLVFPWEGTVEASSEDIFLRLLQFVGEDPERGGLKETPKRCTKAWQYWCSGYNQNPEDVLKLFEDGAELYDEMIHMRGIPFYSHCEHHMAPFFGTVTFAYVPDQRIVGLSKMNRLVDVFARRLQVQERMTRQIVDAFVEHVKPRGAACVVRARHMCMESRGVQHQGCATTTSALHGCIKEQPAARAEFFSLANGI